MIGPMRGKYITFGRAWAFLSPTNHAMSLAHCDPRMTYVRYEQFARDEARRAPDRPHHRAA